MRQPGRHNLMLNKAGVGFVDGYITECSDMHHRSYAACPLGIKLVFGRTKLYKQRLLWLPQQRFFLVRTKYAQFP